MNPSVADFKDSDPTVNDFITFAEKYEKQCRYIKIYNLYPFYETDPKKISKKVNDIISTLGESSLYILLNGNLNLINKEIKFADKIIFGWQLQFRSCHAFNPQVFNLQNL